MITLTVLTAAVAAIAVYFSANENVVNLNKKVACNNEDYELATKIANNL